MDDQHRAGKLRADLFEMRADLVTIAGVVHHHEQDCFFTQGRMFSVALAPFLDTELQIIRIMLGKNGARVFLQAGAAGGVRQYRMLDDILMDGLDQRIIRDGLHEDRAVVVARRGGHIHLQGQPAIPLQHTVVDVLDALEPGHARIVNVMRLVVEDSQFLDLTDDLAAIGLAVGGLADWLGTEGRQEIITQVVIFQRGLAHLAEIHAVDVGEK